eukprot:257898-Pyramimonas_sp.AAC.1
MHPALGELTSGIEPGHPDDVPPITSAANVAFLMPCNSIGKLANNNGFCGSAAMPVSSLVLGFHFTSFSRRLGLRM